MGPPAPRLPAVGQVQVRQAGQARELGQAGVGQAPARRQLQVPQRAQRAAVSQPHVRHRLIALRRQPHARRRRTRYSQVRLVACSGIASLERLLQRGGRAVVRQCAEHSKRL